MSDLDEVLKGVARSVLGLPPEEEKPANPLARIPKEPCLGCEGPLPLPTLERQGSGELPRVEAEDKPKAGPEAPPDTVLLSKLRECERKFQKKVHEAEGLSARLQKAEKARKEAERLMGKAMEEAARWKKESSSLRHEKERLEEALALAKRELEALRPLQGEVEALRKRLRQQEKLLGELEALRREKEALEGRLAKLQDLQKALPEPFPPEALFRVLVLDYPSLAHRAETRLEALIQGYQALLEGKDHPALLHSNRDLLQGEPEGVVLLGLERLLLDLATLPVLRWLRAHAFRLETLLVPESPLTSPRLEE